MESLDHRLERIEAEQSDVLSVEMPKDSFLEVCGSRVDAILVQGRWKRGQRPTLEFIAAVTR